MIMNLIKIINLPVLFSINNLTLIQNQINKLLVLDILKILIIHNLMPILSVEIYIYKKEIIVQ
jgi:hypothetical protein